MIQFLILIFFKIDTSEFKYNSQNGLTPSINDSTFKNSTKKDDSYNKGNKESEKQFGYILEFNHVTNFLNPDGGASFSVSLTVEDSNYSSGLSQKRYKKKRELLIV